jgi:hypothetical protein
MYRRLQSCVRQKDVFSVTEGCVIEGGNEPVFLNVSVVFGKTEEGQSPEVVTLCAV